MPSGNGSSGGHAWERGATLEPTWLTDQARFGRQLREAETSRRRRVCVPLPSAKGGGIRVLQGVRSCRTRPAVASRRRSSRRGPTDPSVRSPRAQWSRRFQRPGAAGFQPTAAVVDGSRTRDIQVMSLVLYL